MGNLVDLLTEFINFLRDVGSISNLGAQHFKGTLFLKKTGPFFKIKRALLCLLQNLGGTYPQGPPVPMSMNFLVNLFWVGGHMPFERISIFTI